MDDFGGSDYDTSSLMNFDGSQKSYKNDKNKNGVNPNKRYKREDIGTLTDGNRNKWKRIDIITNFVAFSYFLLVGIALLVVSLVLDSPNFFGQFTITVPNITGNYGVNININQWRIPIFQMLCIIPFFDSMNHLIAALMGYFKPGVYFNLWINKRFHPLRWVQYAISWSFMNMTLNIILFQGNPLAITADFADTFVINILGLVTEWFDKTDIKINEKPLVLRNGTYWDKFMFWLPFNIGCLLYFRILCTRFALLITDAITFTNIPWEAWLTFFFLLFTEFSFVMILLLSVNRYWYFKNYYVTCLAYTLNSILGKSIFVFVLAGGIWGSSNALNPKN